MEEDDCYDVTIIKDGDIIMFHKFDKGWIIEKGIVKGDNCYEDGVTVYGDGWKQYVGKWFIVSIERAGKLIYNNMKRKSFMIRLWMVIVNYLR
jgi:hypothetical protein